MRIHLVPKAAKVIWRVKGSSEPGLLFEGTRRISRCAKCEQNKALKSQNLQ